MPCHVYARVYNFGDHPLLTRINDKLENIGHVGFFHSSIEIVDDKDLKGKNLDVDLVPSRIVEYGSDNCIGNFGEKHEHGISINEPDERQTFLKIEDISYHGKERFTMPLGKTELDMESILMLVNVLQGSSEWNEREYDLFSHNCNVFVDKFAAMLGVHCPNLNRISGLALGIDRILHVLFIVDIIRQVSDPLWTCPKLISFGFVELLFNLTLFIFQFVLPSMKDMTDAAGFTGACRCKACCTNSFKTTGVGAIVLLLKKLCPRLARLAKKVLKLAFSACPWLYRAAKKALGLAKAFAVGIPKGILKWFQIFWARLALSFGTFQGLAENAKNDDESFPTILLPLQALGLRLNQIYFFLACLFLISITGLVLVSRKWKKVEDRRDD